MSKVKFLGIGARGKVKEFLGAYTTNFLINHGWEILDDNHLMIQTECGVFNKVNKENTLTYVGHNIWSVSDE